MICWIYNVQRNTNNNVWSPEILQAWGRNVSVEKNNNNNINNMYWRFPIAALRLIAL